MSVIVHTYNVCLLIPVYVTNMCFFYNVSLVTIVMDLIQEMQSLLHTETSPFLLPKISLDLVGCSTCLKTISVFSMLISM